MALNRRDFLLGLPLVAGGLGCASGSGTSVTQARTAGRLASAVTPGKPAQLSGSALRYTLEPLSATLFVFQKG